MLIYLLDFHSMNDCPPENSPSNAPNTGVRTGADQPPAVLNGELVTGVSLANATAPEGIRQTIAEGKVFLFTHPRSCGTALELLLEGMGYPAQCNPFDHDYYSIQLRGTDPPAVADTRPEKAFDYVANQLLTLEAPALIRGAGYTIIPHIEEELTAQLLRSFDRIIILVRDPAYTLPSHRRELKEDAHLLTLEEAGYGPLLAIARRCLELGIKPIIFEAHDIRNNPEQILESLDLSTAPRNADGPADSSGSEFSLDTVTWNPGMRDRWGMWVQWKTAVAESDRFMPFVPDPAIEALGKKDPYFAECKQAYDELLAIKAAIDAPVQ